MQQNVLNIAMPKNLTLRNIYQFMKCIAYFFENQNDRCVLLLSIRVPLQMVDIEYAEFGMP